MGSDKATYRKEGLDFGSQLKGSVNQGTEGKVQLCSVVTKARQQREVSAGA